MYGTTRFPHEHVSPCHLKRPTFAPQCGQAIPPSRPSKFIHLSLSFMNIWHPWVLLNFYLTTLCVPTCISKKSGYEQALQQYAIPCSPISDVGSTVVHIIQSFDSLRKGLQLRLAEEVVPHLSLQL